MAILDKTEIEALSHRVFNSRDLESGINEVYRFFRAHLHIDLIGLPVFDAQMGTLRYRAFVDEEGVILADETIRLTKEAIMEARNIVSRKATLIGSMGENPVTREVYSHMGVEEPGTTLPIAVEIGPSRYGVLSLTAWGENQFTPQQLKSIETLYEPISGVVRHILSALEIESLKERLIRATEEIRDRLVGRRVIGALTGLREVMSLAEQAAPLDVPVLIMGETGVGKEVVANAIHHLSKRSDGPMISINCGAIPDTLLDSELFGHEKGAFTGADTIRQGYFEQADRGTIFMDEIGELSLQAQVKLLRVIQDKTFQRVGGRRPITVDVRMVAATNRDLKSLIATLQFRKDLWFRLNVFPIHIPPLRERIIDIPALAEYFIRQQTVEMNLPYHARFASGAMEQLQAYDWPGNVRELKNVIERALITCRGEPLSFPNLDGAPSDEKGRTAAVVAGPWPTLDEMMARHIRQTLKKTNGQVGGKGGAADLLGINASTLRAKMRKLGIQVKRVSETF